jgi:restriction system protein
MLSGGPLSSHPIGGSALNFALKSEPAAGLLLQAVVEYERALEGDERDRGDIIIAVWPAWNEIIRQIERDPKAVFEIDPRKWEEIIAGNYERSGQFDEVLLTPRSGDFGRDIVAIKNGFWSVRIIESVKHYSANRLVGADEVRALSGVLHGDQKASKGIISTTSDFAPRIVEDPYIAPLLPTRLELVSGEQLIKRLTAAL